MNRTAQYVLAGLFALTITSIANAGIVLTAVRTSPMYNQNVSINLYASWDGLQTGGGIPNPSVNSANVGAYQFRVTIAQPVTGLNAAHVQQTNPFTTSAWKDIAPYAVLPSGSPEIAGQTVTFRAANTSETANAAIPNATVGTFINESTLLGTLNFQTTAGLVNLTFTSLQSDDYSAITGFGYVATNSPGQQFNHTLSSPPATIVVVPEPSTFALCGLAGIVGVWRARRKK